MQFLRERYELFYVRGMHLILTVGPGRIYDIVKLPKKTVY